MSKRTGFIGAGNMASALIRGMLHAGLAPDSIFASDPAAERRDKLTSTFGVATTGDNLEVARSSERLVIAVKPQVLPKVVGELSAEVRPETLVISIAAGVPTATLEAKLPPDTRVVRAMPNTAAMALSAATAVAPGRNATSADLEEARSLFESVGRAVVVDEGLLDAVTGLSGSGPAYVLLVIEALADGGVKAGLPRDTALLLAAQTVLGTAQLLLQSGEHPAKLKDMVTSPGGTTIAGLFALERAATRFALMDAVEAATRRSAELGLRAAQPERKPAP